MLDPELLERGRDIVNGTKHCTENDTDDLSAGNMGEVWKEKWGGGRLGSRVRQTDSHSAGNRRGEQIARKGSTSGTSAEGGTEGGQRRETTGLLVKPGSPCGTGPAKLESYRKGSHPQRPGESLRKQVLPNLETMDGARPVGKVSISRARANAAYPESAPLLRDRSSTPHRV